jgi:hypothetical protein
MIQVGGYEFAAIEPCARSECDKLRNQINAACRDLGKPPGAKIMIRSPEGKYCYCICGGEKKS